MPAHVGPNQGLRYGYDVGEDGWGPAATVDLKRIDALLHRKVINRTTNTPPGSPSDGDRYVVGPSPTGAWAGQTNKIAVYDADGGAWLFYVPAKGWDVFSEADGAAFWWSGSAWVMAAWVNAAMFATIQAAVDAIVAIGGGEVFIPPGTYHASTTPAFTTIVIPTTGKVHIRGAGQQNTILQGSGGTTDFITIKGSNSSISDLTIRGDGTDGSSSASGGACILIGDVAGNVVVNTTLRNVSIYDAPRFGVYIAGQDSSGSGPYTMDLRSEAVGTLAVHTMLDNVFIAQQFNAPATPANCVGILIGWGCTTTWMNRVYIQSRGATIYEWGNGTTFHECIFETAFEDAALIKVGLGIGTRFHACWFETNFSQDGSGKYFIETEGIFQGVSIDKCHFARTGASNAHPMVLRTDVAGAGTPCRGVKVSGCTAVTTSSPTGDDDIWMQNAADQVLVEDCQRHDGGYSVTPTPWRVKTTSGGARLTRAGSDRFKLPALTTTERDALLDVSAGDLIFNTTTGSVQRHNGTSWANVP